MTLLPPILGPLVLTAAFLCSGCSLNLLDCTPDPNDTTRCKKDSVATEKPDATGQGGAGPAIDNPGTGGHAGVAPPDAPVLDSNETSGVVCPAGQHACGGKCIDVGACCDDRECGANRACRNGMCVVTCTPGASCNLGSPCRAGSISCESGAPVCVDIGPDDDKGGCGGGNRCQGGACVPDCVPGGSCGNNPCKPGTWECVNGQRMCVERDRSGGSCGASAKCEGNGIRGASSCQGGTCQPGDFNPCPQPANSTAACLGTTCSFTCNDGFVKSGDRCVPSPPPPCGEYDQKCCNGMCKNAELYCHSVGICQPKQRDDASCSDGDKACLSGKCLNSICVNTGSCKTGHDGDPCGASECRTIDGHLFLVTSHCKADSCVGPVMYNCLKECNAATRTCRN